MQGRIIKQLPNWATAVIGAVVLIIVGYLVVSALTGGDEKSGAAATIELPANITGSAEFMGQVVPTSDNAYYVGGRWIAKPTEPTEPTEPVLPVTVSEIPEADQTADEDELVDEPEADEPVDEPEADESGNTQKADDIVIKTSTFRDWVDGELNIKDTDIADFTVFPSKVAAQEFVDGYKWNKKHNDFSWNYEEFGYYVADEYGESDPAPAAFFTSTTAYFVVISGDGLTPDYYQLDSDVDTEFKLIEKKGDEKSVYAVDHLETEA